MLGDAGGLLLVQVWGMKDGETDSSRSFLETRPSFVSTVAARRDKARVLRFTSQIAGWEGKMLHARVPTSAAVVMGEVRCADVGVVAYGGVRSCGSEDWVFGGGMGCSLVGCGEVCKSASFCSNCSATGGFSSRGTSASTATSPSAIDCVYAGGVTTYRSASLSLSLCNMFKLSAPGLAVSVAALIMLCNLTLLLAVVVMWASWAKAACNVFAVVMMCSG